LRGQEKVTKEKATPRTRPSRIRALRVRSQTPEFADGASMHPRRTGPHPVDHPSGCSCVRSPRPRGPIWRASCALYVWGGHSAPLRTRPWMAGGRSTSRAVACRRV